MQDDKKREIYHFTAPEGTENERLDLFMVRMAGPELSRTRAQNMIKNGCVKRNGQVCTLPRERIFVGDTVDADAPAQEITVKAEPEQIPLDVMFEDESILVVNKPAGMVVHPAAGNWSGTLVNALLGREPDLMDEDEMDPLRPGIVHRLDKDTSGALVIAKTPKALRKLSRMFAEREVEKTYLAIVHGWPVPNASVIKTAFGRHPVDRKRMAVLRPGEGREAVTAYYVLQKGWYKGVKVALVRVRIHTGRTHQIRVHMAYAGFPLMGDRLYNRRLTSDAPRQMLHAWQLNFVHPHTGEELEFEAPVPDDFQTILDAITDEKE